LTVVQAVYKLTLLVSVQVSGNEEMDSDDEDGDETEHALRKHTLLTILYLYHPDPVGEVRRKVEAALGPESGGGAMDGITVQSATVGAEGLSGAAASSGAAGSTAAVHDIDEQAALEALSGAMPKEHGTTPAFDVVLVGETLYFYHNMRFYFSLDVSHCGDKAAFRAARAWEKLEFVETKRRVLREREKNSVFYLDTSSEEEDERSELSSFDLPLSRINSRGSLITPLPPTTPPFSASQSARDNSSRQRGHSRGHRGRGRKLRGGRHIKTIDAGAPAIVDAVPVFVPRPRVLAVSKAPPNYPIKAWVIQLVCYDK
jgi:hypothetical protein